MNQVELCTLVGNALGNELKTKILCSLPPTSNKKESKFSCPLDEALVTCVLASLSSTATTKSNDNDGNDNDDKEENVNTKKDG